MVIKEIRLQSPDVEALYGFYCGKLQMDVIRSGGGITLAAGESKLIFECCPATVRPFYHFAFNIPGNQFEQSYKWIRAAAQLLEVDGGKGQIADFKPWHAKSFYFRDPQGNIVELITRFDLKDPAPKPFSAEAITSISEIGVVFPASSFGADVVAAMKEYGLDYFDKQPPHDHFRALGNDEGLWIAVPEGRPWFPTHDKARIFPTEVTFIDKNKMHKLVIA